jgi:hypothetical protein
MYIQWLYDHLRLKCNTVLIRCHGYIYLSYYDSLNVMVNPIECKRHSHFFSKKQSYNIFHYCTIMTKCPSGVTHDTKCPLPQVSETRCDLWQVSDTSLKISYWGCDNRYFYNAQHSWGTRNNVFVFHIWYAPQGPKKLSAWHLWPFFQVSGHQVWPLFFAKSVRSIEACYAWPDTWS